MEEQASQYAQFPITTSQLCTSDEEPVASVEEIDSILEEDEGKLDDVDAVSQNTSDDVIQPTSETFKVRQLSTACENQPVPEFSAVQHRIHTGDALPVRQRMHHTSLGFEPEEEQHINKMIKTGVIRPSPSEWALQHTIQRISVIRKLASLMIRELSRINASRFFGFRL